MGERLLGSTLALLAAAGLACGQGSGGLTEAPRSAPPALASPPTTLPDTLPGPGCDVPSPSCPAPAMPEPSAYSSNNNACWVDAEYLYWWIKNAPLPSPLLTTGPVGTSAANGFGALGQPGTQVLVGHESLDEGQSHGGRFTIGGWINGYPAMGFKAVGVEASYFFLGRRAAHVDAEADATGNPVLARPVFDARSGQETVELVSAPGFFGSPGRFSLTATNELWGAEGNVFLPVVGKQGLLIDFLGGLRYLNLEESLDISQNTGVLANGVGFFNGTAVQMPGALAISDSFNTKNNFYGGQIGAQVVGRWGLLSVTALTKAALGTMVEEATIQGRTTLTQFGVSSTTPGGLLALSSNSGSHFRNRFAVVPEGRLTIGLQVTENFSLSVGYTFLYASDVLRPGNQIDRVVNPTLLPSSAAFGPLSGSPRPAFQFRESEFWTQGFTAGLSLSF